jgi:hypothetical protein
MRIGYLLFFVLSVAGAALFASSKPLSRKYNAWTTQWRTKHQWLSPPPTPQAAELNSRIMFVLFRLLGAWLFILGLWAAYATLLS